MKMFSRIMLLMAVMVALLVPTAAFAQEDQPCYGLDATNCALMYSAVDASSFSMAFTFQVKVEPEADINADGKGTFSLVPEATDPLKSFNMDMVVNSSAVVEGETEAATIEFRIIDGVFYLSDGEEWSYFQLGGLFEMIAAQSGMNLQDLMAGEMGGMGDMTGMADAMSPFGDLLMSYITAERGADITVDGNTVAVFTTNLDLAGLFADPNLNPAITAALPAIMEMAAAQSGGEIPEMTEEDLQQVQQMIPMILGMMQMVFAQSSASMTQHVGVDDHNFYGFATHFEMTLDPSMMAMLGGGGDEAPSEPMNILFDLTVQLTNHNQTFSYTAPEGATEIPLDAMMGMGSF